MKKKSLSVYLKNYMMVLVLIALLVVFGILCPIFVGRPFLTVKNLLNILGQNAYMVILGVGITFIMLGGAMDLSTGYLISTVGIAMALINQNSNFAVTLVCGAAVSLQRCGVFLAPGVSVYYHPGHPVYPQWCHLFALRRPQQDLPGTVRRL